MGRLKILEDDVKKEVIQYLNILGIFFWRNNTGRYREGSRWISYGKVGSSDILAIYPDTGQLWAIELKKPGGELSDEQIQFLLDIRANGGVASVVESSVDVGKVLVHPKYLPDRYKDQIEAYKKI